MKIRSTTPVINVFTTKTLLVVTAVLMAVSSPIVISQIANARDFEGEIRAIQAQIDQYQAQARALGEQADSLQKELQSIDQEKSTIQAQIDLSQAKYDKLQQDIIDTEKKIQETQDTLGKILANIYADDSITPLEMLASSKNIGDYLDKQEYRSSISSNLKTTIDKIKDLKKQLEKQKKDTEKVLADQNNAKAALVAKEQERANLLAQTQNSEENYKNMSAAAQAQKLQVMQAQQAAITAAYRGNGGMIQAGGTLGSYASWAGNCYVDGNAWSHGGVNGNGEDPLGYGCNQCVSYTAWKMMQVTGWGPSYWGNANMWPAKARSLGYKVSSTPRANSLGVISAGQYGHIVYVQNYNASNNTVDISQYNEWLPGLGWGRYSERYGASAYTYDSYIYL